jgi:hypothetical protein
LQAVVVVAQTLVVVVAPADCCIMEQKHPKHLTVRHIQLLTE